MNIALAVLSIVVLYFVFHESLKMKREAKAPVAPLGQNDLEAFSNLLSESDTEFMRARLSAAEFRKFERDRGRVLLEYVNGLSAFAASRIRVLTAPGVATDQAHLHLLLSTRQVALRTGLLLQASLWAPQFLNLANRGRMGCQNLARSCNSMFAAEVQIAAASSQR